MLLLVLFIKKDKSEFIINKPTNDNMTDIYDDDEFVALRQLVPHAKLGCLLCHDNNCTNHFEVFTTLYEKDETDPEWLMHLECTVCKSYWAICTVCNNFKIRMNNNRMISIHRSTYHGKNNNRIRKPIIVTLNDNKKQKLEETTPTTTNDMIDGNNTTPISSNDDNNLKNYNEEIIKLANEILDNKNNAIMQANGQPSDTFETTIYFESDDILPSSQIEYDITIGSSVGDDKTVEIIDSDKTINETNIEIGNNDETTVTEKSINYENDNGNATNAIIINRYTPVNLFNNLKEAMKIKSIVSLHVCINISF
jgi:hypothetical protein